MADAIGADDEARDAVRLGPAYRDDDGGYWTGIVFPDEGRFPGGERTTYTAAAVVLAADALAGGSPAERAVHPPRRVAARGVRGSRTRTARSPTATDRRRVES